MEKNERLTPLNAFLFSVHTLLKNQQNLIRLFISYSTHQTALLCPAQHRKTLKYHIE